MGGWGREEKGREGEEGQGGGAEPEAGDASAEGTEDEEVVKVNTKSKSANSVIRSSGSPSNLSLGDPDDDVEFVLSPVPPTRVREIDERRDNPERDGFAEIEESGLYEIKIEVQNEAEGGGSERVVERISPLGSDDGREGEGGGGVGVEGGGLRDKIGAMRQGR